MISAPNTSTVGKDFFVFKVLDASVAFTTFNATVVLIISLRRKAVVAVRTRPGW